MCHHLSNSSYLFFREEQQAANAKAEESDNEEDHDGTEPQNIEKIEAADDDDGNDDDELPAELNMDKYDDEEERDIFALDDDEDEAGNMMVDGVAMDEMEMEEDEEDEEDDRIETSDSVLLLATTEDEYSHLEVQVLTADGSLYTHHDILLPDFPLCLAWLDCPPCQSAPGEQKSVGSYVAVGTFEPAIEIWNLDVLDPVEPSAVLGGEDTSKSKAKKSGKSSKSSSKKRFLPGSHEGSVMALSWNSMYRQALASGSADHTVKIWDVTTQACSYTFNHHSDKVT